VAAVDFAPESAPANEPATLAEPFESGRPNPVCWAGPVTTAYPENEATLAWTVAGDHATATSTALGVVRLTQLLSGLWMVAVALPPVTAVMFEPVVVQPAAAREMCVVSGLVPVFESGGTKVTVPVTFVHVTLPVATVPPATVLGVTPVAEDAVVLATVVVVGWVVLVEEPEEPEEQLESTATRATGRAVSTTRMAPRGGRRFMRPISTAGIAPHRGVGPTVRGLRRGLVD
jgi:hypothetical protein